MSASDLITPALVYLLAGSLVWLILDGLGIVANTFEARFARGRPVALLAGAMATALAILVWPKIVWTFWKNRKSFWASLKARRSS